MLLSAIDIGLWDDHLAELEALPPRGLPSWALVTSLFSLLLVRVIWGRIRHPSAEKGATTLGTTIAYALGVVTVSAIMMVTRSAIVGLIIVAAVTAAIFLHGLQYDDL